MFREKQREITYTIEKLREFELRVSQSFEKALIHGPVHLSYGNEDYLIDLFQYINPNDWVFSTWRNHYHALLHGVPEDELMNKILQGHSISFQSPEHNFFTSAIVNGIVPIAVGTALGIKWQDDAINDEINPLQPDGFRTTIGWVGDRRMVWCFVGDMTAESGTFYEAVKYSIRNELPIHFVVEDNGLSTNTPTQVSWGTKNNGGFCDEAKEFYKDPFVSKYISYFKYERTKYPHQGTGTWINF
jgi:TPP-dependent pyruvate/acetoin dehydrogenase alpha subunit